MGPPALLEIPDQRRADVALGLLARVGRHVGLEEGARLLADPQRPAVAGGADAAGARQRRAGLIDRLVHGAGWDHLVAQQPSLGALGLEPSVEQDRLTRQPLA